MAMIALDESRSKNIVTRRRLVCMRDAARPASQRLLHKACEQQPAYNSDSLRSFAPALA